MSLKNSGNHIPCQYMTTEELQEEPEDPGSKQVRKAVYCAAGWNSFLI